MEYRHQQLRTELSKLNKTFADLGNYLTGVAKDLSSAGVPPDDRAIEQILAARKSFEAVRSAVHGLAGEMLIKPLPRPEEIGTIAAIDSLLGLAANAEENRNFVLQERAQALAVLARVLSIVHREQPDFKPLMECLSVAKALSDAIANTPWPSRHPEAENLIADRHPLTALLSMVVNRDVLDDDKWIQLEETVTGTYSKALSVAASRNRLTMNDGSKPAPVPQNGKAQKTAEPAKAPAPASTAASPVAASPAPPSPAAATPAGAVPPPPASAAQPAPAPAATPPSNAVLPAAPAEAPKPEPVKTPEPPKAEPSKPAAPVAAERKPLAQPAAPAPVAQPAPPPPSPAPTPVAVAQPAGIESKPSAPAPVEEKRKEPRVVAPAAKAPEHKPEERPSEADDKKPVGAGAGAGLNAGDRPQRWGFWRGNR